MIFESNRWITMKLPIALSNDEVQYLDLFQRQPSGDSTFPGLWRRADRQLPWEVYSINIAVA